MSNSHEWTRATTGILQRRLFSKETPLIQRGKSYVELILKTAEITGLPVNQIQFNFCLKDKNVPLSSDRVAIQKAIDAYIAYAKYQKLLSASELAVFDEKVILPENASALTDYSTTLQDRSASFLKAANLLIKNSEHLSESDKLKYYEKVGILSLEFANTLGSTLDDTQAQSYYDAFLDTLKSIVKEVIPPVPGVEMTEMAAKQLENAETLCNINARKAQVTLSGQINSSVKLQIEQPLNRFRDFSPEQKKEWLRTYWAYHRANNNPDKLKIPDWMALDTELKIIGKSDTQKELPSWFGRLSNWEKSHWISLMDEVIKNNQDVCMGPVVKKAGVPGLRNLSLSSYATIQHVDRLYSGKHVTEMVVTHSPPTIRSSNIIAQYKEGKAELSIDEAALTESNIRQVDYLYKKLIHKKESPIDFPWQWNEKHKPILLLQTLLRKLGGGDDHVIEHKDKLAGRLNAQNFIIETSNHCIGAPPTKMDLSRRVFELMGTSTKSNHHVISPVTDFVNNAVFTAVEKVNPPDADKNSHPKTIMTKASVQKVFSLAKKGELNDGAFYKNIEGLNNAQFSSLHRVMFALNDYVKTNKAKNYSQNYQLHLAALEEIIYQYSGHQIQSSCKSGKDREGVLKCYRNALCQYYDETGKFPPVEPSTNQKPSPERERFVEIFIELFKTHHQARLAELNASGCSGLKALNNILPKDMYDALKASGPDLLDNYKKNSALNVLGGSKIERDPVIYKKAQENFFNSCGIKADPTPREQVMGTLRIRNSSRH